MNKFFNRKVITIIGFTTAILCGCSSTAKNFAETTSSAVDGAAVSESTESVTSNYWGDGGRVSSFQQDH